MSMHGIIMKILSNAYSYLMITYVKHYHSCKRSHMVERILQIIYLADTGTCFWRDENNIFPSDKGYEFMAINCSKHMSSAVCSCGWGARGTISQ